MTDSTPKKETVFVSYSHADNEGPDPSIRWLDRLCEHLDSVQLEMVWSDTDIASGDDWHQAIREKIEDAAVAVLLVSPAFLGSKFIREHEIPLLLERRDSEGLRVIPLIVRPCAIDRTHFLYPDPADGPRKLSLTKLQAHTGKFRALSTLPAPEQDTVLASLAAEVKDIIEGRPRKKARPSRTDRVGKRKPLPARISRFFARFVALAAAALLLYALWESQFRDPPTQASVLFSEISASDRERLDGATENDVYRLAMECQDETLRGLARILKDDPVELMSLVRLALESPGMSPAEAFALSEADRLRLAGATENDVIRLAKECENEIVQKLAGGFSDRPKALLSIVEELKK